MDTEPIPPDRIKRVLAKYQRGDEANYGRMWEAEKTWWDAHPWEHSLPLFLAMVDEASLPDDSQADPVGLIHARIVLRERQYKYEIKRAREDEKRIADEKLMAAYAEQRLEQERIARCKQQAQAENEKADKHKLELSPQTRARLIAALAEMDAAKAAAQPKPQPAPIAWPPAPVARVKPKPKKKAHIKRHENTWPTVRGDTVGIAGEDSVIYTLSEYPTIRHLADEWESDPDERIRLSDIQMDDEVDELFGTWSTPGYFNVNAKKRRAPCPTQYQPPASAYGPKKSDSPMPTKS